MMAAKMFPKKLTPTSCRCAGKGACAACKAKAAKARAMKGDKKMMKGY